jgi:hypothetical protein
MKHLKMLSLAAFAAMVLMAIGAGTASATTLEVKGVKQTGAVETKFSLEAGASLKLVKTDGTFVFTCTESSIAGKTSTFTGTAVSGPISSFTFLKCTSEPIVFDKAGSLSVESITGTTNGTVKWSGGELTLPTPFGTINCKSGEGTDMGTLTGKATGQATWDLKAVMNCGILAPSVIWEGAYVATSPEGLGVTS